MKNVKKLALALVFSCATIGAGYAYWADQVTINNTVTTGEFAVNFVNTDGYPKLFGRTNEPYVGKLDHTGNQGFSLVSDAKSTTINISNMYPDSYARYELKIRNDGTIPAVFDNATVDLAGSTAGFNDKLQTQVFVKKYHANGTAYAVGEPGYWAGQSLGYKPASNLQANLNTIMAGLRLEPNEFITFDVPDEYLAEWQATHPGDDGSQCFEILLPGTVGTVSNPDEFENATAKFNIKINWKQHNKI